MKRDLCPLCLDAGRSPRTDEALRRDLQSLGSMVAIQHAIHSQPDVSGIVDKALEFARDVDPCDAARMCVIASGEDHEYEVFTAGSTSAVDRLTLSAHERGALETGVVPTSIRLDADASDAPSFLRSMIEAGMQSAVLLPMVARDRLVGLLTLGRRDPAGFEAEQIAPLVGLADATAIAIDNARIAEKSELLANFDTLTGLINRRIFFDRLARVLTAAERGQHMAAVCFIDLDNFKRVNDTVGHLAGDRVLRQISQRLVSCLRQGDSVCRIPSGDSSVGREATAEEPAPEEAISRLGGDEFAVVLSKISDARDAAYVAKRVSTIFDSPYMIDGRETFLSASIGLAVYPFDGRDAGTLLRNADTAMFCAKKRGKNGFQYYTKSMNAEASRRLHIETRLRSALERNEFTLFYQQQRDTRTGRLIGAEALVRWDDPEMGLVSPAEFIPLAEQTGCIVPIGEWVLRAACAQLREWQLCGYDDFRLAVNLSPHQLHQRGFSSTVGEILSETGVGPGQLELEITETTLMEEDDATLDNLEALHDMGIELALDDFGTGYSSLSYLRRLSLDVVKIDRSFVSELPESLEDQAVTRAIVAMAHSLQLRVVAEGVETEEQARYLREIDCDVLQGFLFGRPVPAEEFEILLAKKTEEDQ